MQTVPERLAEIWTRAARLSDGAFILSLEDDIEPLGGFPALRLYEGLTPSVDAVAAYYRTRPIDGQSRELLFEWKQRPDGALALDLKHDYPGGTANPPTEGCLPIGATGVGFTLIRRDVLDGYDFNTGRLTSWVGQDFGLWRHVRERGNKLMCAFGVKVRHWYKEDEYV